MKTKLIGEWNGDFDSILQLISHWNSDITVHQQGKKLILIKERFHCCALIGDSIVIPLKFEVVGIWDSNYRDIVSAIDLVNTEILVRQQGKKLIIRDRNTEYYSSHIPGDNVEIPVYEGCWQPDEPCFQEIKEEKKIAVVTEEWIKMQQDWGLL